LIEDPRTHDNIARVQNRQLVTEAISAWTTLRTKAEVVEEFAGRVPVGPVNTVADIFNDPHVQARQMLADVDLPGNNRPVQLANQAIKFTATPAGVYRRPPLLDEHRGEILGEIGITVEEAPAPTLKFAFAERPDADPTAEMEAS
jgi:crotonobetainyl-CoA:carnitine CoA-transferase CaiB-like acyl-CoA transferase